MHESAFSVARINLNRCSSVQVDGVLCAVCLPGIPDGPVSEEICYSFGLRV